MMEKMGFSRSYIASTMRCVSTAYFSILLNGQPSRKFLPSRSLRQGDPLSPFLFFLCAEGLSTLLRDAEAKKEIHGVKIGKKVEPISHLFFLLMAVYYLLKQMMKKWRKFLISFLSMKLLLVKN